MRSKITRTVTDRWGNTVTPPRTTRIGAGGPVSGNDYSSRPRTHGRSAQEIADEAYERWERMKNGDTK
jgi:hypothetical protein